MRKYIVIIFLAVIGFYSLSVFIPFNDEGKGVPFGEDRMKVGKQYLEKTPELTGASNVVTAIVVNYRGFDTLGEVTVLFLASTGLGAILFSTRRKEDEEKLERTESSPIVKAGAKLLFPLVLLLGVYVFVHGHLTPGGGFQGGAIVATGALLMFISYKEFKVSHTLLSVLESFAGITFVTVGLTGLIMGSTFLENFLPLGNLNDLFSAGIIPVIYIAVGFKVGAELIGLLDTMLKTLD